MSSILLASADPTSRERIRNALAAHGWWVSEVEDRQGALRAASNQEPDLLVVDGELPGAQELLRNFGLRNGGPGAVIVTRREPHDGAFGLYEDGADAVLSRPLRDDDLVSAVRRVLEAPRAPVAGGSIGAGRRLTAAELFGDVIAELGGEPETGEPRPPAGRPPEEAEIDEIFSLPPTPPSARPPAGQRRPAVESPDSRAPGSEPPGVERPPSSPGRPPSAVGGEAGRDAPSPSPKPIEPPSAPGRRTAPRASSPRPRIEPSPRRFGQYELIERIAVGGMAEVWKARMTGVEGFEKTVAIKKILPHLTESEDFERMFIDEAKLAAGLNHPNIIHIYDLGHIGDEYFIAMEYVEGWDLRSILNRARQQARPIPLGLSLLIAARLASALAYAHRRQGPEREDLGVVHRDVSPRNVLVGLDGRVKLCDFGVAKAASSIGQTQYGALKGKLQYMSPEQAWGEPVDARSDIFALGAVLFELVTGERLFSAGSEVGLLEAVRQCLVRSPRQVDPAVPEALDRIITRALAKNPDGRFPDAAAMQRELEEQLHQLKPSPGGDELADFLGELFESARLRRPAAAAAEAVPAAAAAAGAAAEEEGSADTAAEAAPGAPAPWRRVRKLAVAAAILVAAGLLAWALWTRRGAGETMPAPAPAPVAATAPAPGEPAPAAGEEGSGEPAVSGEEAPAPPARSVATPAPAAAPPQNERDALENLIDEEVARRESELRAAFLEEERQLQRELARLRASDESAEEPSAEEPPGGEPPPK